MIRFQCLLLERLSWVIWHQLFCSEVSLSSTAHVFDVKLELWQVLHISLTMTTYDDLWPWWGDLWSDERGVKHLSAGCQCSRDGKGRGHCICSHYIHVGPSRDAQALDSSKQCVFSPCIHSHFGLQRLHGASPYFWMLLSPPGVLTSLNRNTAFVNQLHQKGWQVFVF